jgi:hypothetical protein
MVAADSLPSVLQPDRGQTRRVGRREKEDSVLLQGPSSVLEKRFGLRKVFQDLKGANGIDGSRANRKGGRVGLEKTGLASTPSGEAKAGEVKVGPDDEKSGEPSLRAPEKISRAAADFEERPVFVPAEFRQGAEFPPPDPVGG